MKKLVMASLLALGVSVACQQKASAWSEFKFSAGVNLGWVGGDNSCFWGLRQSGPYPGSVSGLTTYVRVPQSMVAPYCGAPAGAYGGYAGAPAGDFGGVAAQAPAAQTAPAMQPVPAAAGTPHAYNPYETGYQPVGYYYYPGYSAYPVPAYWYGR